MQKRVTKLKSSEGQDIIELKFATFSAIITYRALIQISKMETQLSKNLAMESIIQLIFLDAKLGVFQPNYF
jgi:hypothetical protein